jgi:hypothetical protein
MTKRIAEKRIAVSEQFLTDTYEYLIKYAKEHPDDTDVLFLVGYAWAARNLAAPIPGTRLSDAPPMKRKKGGTIASPSRLAVER